MAIKKRARPALDSEAIDSFGEAAEVPVEPVKEPTLRQPAPSPAVPPVAVGWPEGMPKTFLLRYPDATLPAEIEELHRLLGRNKHQTVLLALRRGIDVLRREVEELGDRAELIK